MTDFIKKLLLILAILTPVTVSADITTGLVRYWPMNEGSGATVLNEVIVNADATVAGATTTGVAGQIGNAVEFEFTGVGQATASPSLVFANGTARSISFWAKHTSIIGAGSSQFAMGFSGNGTRITLPKNTGANIWEYRFGSGAINNTTADVTITANVWRHYVVTVDTGKIARLYINGVLQTNTINFSASNTGDTFDQLGAVNGTLGSDMVLDDVRIYNRALPQADVTELFNYTGPAPLAGGDLDVTSYDNDQINVTWTNATGGTPTITAQLQISPAGAGTWTNVSGATTSPAVVSDLAQGTGYDLRVVYTDSLSETAFSDTESVTTESPADPWAIKVIYDSGTFAQGTTTTFTRNIATVDERGETVPANKRRFAGVPSVICGQIEWSNTGVTYGSNSQIVGSGRGQGNDHLVFISEYATGSLRVLEVNPDGTVTLLSTTLFSALPGVGSGITYRIDCCSSYYGLIVASAERFSAGSSVGVTLFYSQDDGNTWTRVENSTADGGGFDVPAGYGGATAGNSRLRIWSGATPYPVGGIDDEGHFSKTEVWFPWVDYLQAEGGTARGYQAGVFKATRPDTSSPWVVGKDRVIGNRYVPTATVTVHGHSSCMMDNGSGVGGMIVVYGDTAPSNGMDYFAFDLIGNNYESATITTTNDWHGGITPAASHGPNSLQPASGCPGPDHSILMAADEWYEMIVKIDYAANGSTPPSISGPIYNVADFLNGNRYAGWTPFPIWWYPEVGWTAGSADDTIAGGNVCSLISYDGRNWGWRTSSDVVNGNAHIAGDYIVGLDSSFNINTAALPSLHTVRPLLLNRGLDNKIGSNPAENHTSPSGGNVRRQAYWDASTRKFRYLDNDGEVANAPDYPIGIGTQYYVLDNADPPTSELHGIIYVQDSGQTISIANTIHMGMYAASLTPKLSLDVSLMMGIGTTANDKTFQLGWKPGANRAWYPLSWFNDPTNNGSGRGLVQLLSGVGSTLAPNHGDIMLAFTGLHEGNWPTYPTGANTTANPNEVEIVNLPGVDLDWQVSVTIIRQQISPTDEANDDALSGNLFTLVMDADSYAVVSWDAATHSAVITLVVNGVTVDTISLAAMHWLRGAPMTFAFGNGSTVFRAGVTSIRKGNVYDEVEGVAFTEPITQIKFSGPSDTTPYPLGVASVSYKGGEVWSGWQLRDKLSSMESLESDQPKVPVLGGSIFK